MCFLHISRAPPSVYRSSKVRYARPCPHPLESKTNRRVWLPRFFIINPFSAPHKGLKVHPTTLTFKVRRVKNFVAIIYSLDPLFFPNVILSPSLSSKESRVHCYERSSMATGQMKGRNKTKAEEEKSNGREEEKRSYCFPISHERITH